MALRPGGLASVSGVMIWMPAQQPQGWLIFHLAG
jgi:hypothetical protein